MVDGVNVHTFDSRLAAMIEGSFVIYAIQLVEKVTQLKKLLMN